MLRLFPQLWQSWEKTTNKQKLLWHFFFHPSFYRNVCKIPSWTTTLQASKDTSGLLCDSHAGYLSVLRGRIISDPDVRSWPWPAATGTASAPYLCTPPSPSQPQEGPGSPRRWCYLCAPHLRPRLCRNLAHPTKGKPLVYNRPRRGVRFCGRTSPFHVVPLCCFFTILTMWTTSESMSRVHISVLTVCSFCDL